MSGVQSENGIRDRRLANEYNSNEVSERYCVSMLGSDIYNSTDPNEMWLQWKCLFLSLVNKHVPLRTMRVRMRSGLKKRMTDRDILEIKASKPNDSGDWKLFAKTTRYSK